MEVVPPPSGCLTLVLASLHVVVSVGSSICRQYVVSLSVLIVRAYDPSLLCFIRLMLSVFGMLPSSRLTVSSFVEKVAPNLLTSLNGTSSWAKTELGWLKLKSMSWVGGTILSLIGSGMISREENSKANRRVKGGESVEDLVESRKPLNCSNNRCSVVVSRLPGRSVRYIILINKPSLLMKNKGCIVLYTITIYIQ